MVARHDEALASKQILPLPTTLLVADGDHAGRLVATSTQLPPFARRGQAL